MDSDELISQPFLSRQRDLNLARAALLVHHDSPLLKQFFEARNDSTDSDLSLDDIVVDAPEAYPSFVKPAVKTPKGRLSLFIVFFFFLVHKWWLYSSPFGFGG